ncbi:hypothetical protein [Pseudomonas juntendi]|uniref:hypothetical protein n=1 Tax=Pseudomonas juntendi TaxID=2666183 RepID=UPI001F398AD1|nr:hypothetical protein [Pseudomonas juntendi]
MTTAPVKSLIDEQIEQIERSLAMASAGTARELPESMEIPGDRILMVFKGLTLEDAMNQARMAHIENPAAWSERAYLCGMCTLAYEVRT